MEIVLFISRMILTACGLDPDVFLRKNQDDGSGGGSGGRSGEDDGNGESTKIRIIALEVV
jgi:hypothetical protein